MFTKFDILGNYCRQVVFILIRDIFRYGYKKESGTKLWENLAVFNFKTGTKVLLLFQ